MRALDALVETTGVAPVGYRAPAAHFSLNTIDVLLEQGVLYDSSCSASDFYPYYLRQGDRSPPDGPYVFGRCANLVEIPFNLGMSDFPHFEFVLDWSTEQSPPSAVHEIWQGEFEYAYANCPGGVFDLILHPQVIGRRHRLVMLETLIEDMRARPGVVFEAMGDYARRWKASNPLEEWKKANPILARKGPA